MEFVGRDTNFCTQAKFKTIGKPGTGVDHDAGGINLAQKSLCVHVITREDGIGVMT